MRSILGGGFGIFLLLTSTCYAESSTLDASRSGGQIDGNISIVSSPSSVTVVRFADLHGKYVKLGVVSVGPRRDFGDVDIEELKTQAARLGANAIVVLPQKGYYLRALAIRH